ncbi:MAG: hypothetical protein HC802_04610 [Caldilineaceae bacterium]|nr:hypothetical protein [Caldilineaceae bacterium]
MLLLGLGIVLGKLKFDSLRGTSLIHLAVWAYLVVNMVSLLAGSDDNLRFMVITFYMVGIFYFIKMYVTSEATMRLVMFGYLASALLSVALLTLDYTGIGPGGIFVVNNRAKALFKDANVFGPYLVIVILFLIDEIWRPHLIRKSPVLKLLAVTALAAALFLSFSRAAWGNLALALAVYGLLNLRQVTGKIVVRGLFFGVLAVLILAVIVNATGLQEFLLWRATAVQNYDFDRLAAQQEAVRQGFANLLGLGPGMMDIGFYSPHSLYARSFGEHGILGFAALVLLLGALLVQSFTHAVRVTDRVYGLSPKVVFASAVGLFFQQLCHRYTALAPFLVSPRAALDSGRLSATS